MRSSKLYEGKQFAPGLFEVSKWGCLVRAPRKVRQYTVDDSWSGRERGEQQISLTVCSRGILLSYRQQDFHIAIFHASDSLPDPQNSVLF